MSRGNRLYSEFGIYHIVFRGVNKQNIFEEEFDYKVMLGYLKEVQKDISFDLCAYCLMTNHVHLLIKEAKFGDISLIMKKLLVKYAMYYNNKYDRKGHLFESRYKSKAITSDNYLFASLKYIHENPVKAFIVESIEEYQWSSYKEYAKNLHGLTNKDFIFSIIDIIQFKSLHNDTLDSYDPFDKKQSKLIELKNDIISDYGIEPNEVSQLPYENKKQIIVELRKKYSIREIEKITGIKKSTIAYEGKN